MKGEDLNKLVRKDVVLKLIDGSVVEGTVKRVDSKNVYVLDTHTEKVLTVLLNRLVQVKVAEPSST